MHPSIARYLNRHRDTIASAIAQPLAAALGAEQARQEAVDLVTGLGKAFLLPDPGAFLTHIRETDAIAQVVRMFDDEDVHHVSGEVDPARDITKSAAPTAARKCKISKYSKALYRDLY